MHAKYRHDEYIHLQLFGGHACVVTCLDETVFGRKREEEEVHCEGGRGGRKKRGRGGRSSGGAAGAREGAEAAGAREVLPELGSSAGRAREGRGRGIRS